MKYVKCLNINGVDAKQVACIELHGAPNAATEGAVGVLGIDVDSPTHDIYKCVAVNGAIYTWKPCASGSGGVGVTPVFEVDEVVTLEAGEHAYVDIDNADPTKPRISFGIPKGAPGESIVQLPVPTENTEKKLDGEGYYAVYVYYSSITVNFGVFYYAPTALTQVLYAGENALKIGSDGSLVYQAVTRTVDDSGNVFTQLTDYPYFYTLYTAKL